MFNTSSTEDQPVVIYARVSTEEQGARGVSIAGQVERCQAYAKVYGLRVVAVVEDPGFSAASLRRPGWARVAAMLDAGEAEGVVVAKLDRLTRSLRDMDALLSDYFTQGLVLRSVAEEINTGGASGRLVLNIMVAMAQWERETTSERTSAALQRLKARGEKYRGPGKPKLGELPGEAAGLAEARRLRAQGMSFARIVDHLNAGPWPARGARWYATTLQRALQRA